MRPISLIFILLITARYNISHAQRLSSTQVQFLEQNVSILAKEPNAAINWQSIDAALKDETIVFLGEPNHGAKEIFEFRNQLIKHLHEELDFNVLLLESGIGELIAANLDKDQPTPKDMTQGLFGNWRTAEFRDLISYCQSNNISIAGFDVQRTGTTFKKVLQRTIEEGGLDTREARDVESRYGAMHRRLNKKKVTYDSVNVGVNQLIDDYLHLHDLLSTTSLPGNQVRNDAVLRTITNRVEYLTFMLAFVQERDWRKRFTARDSLMAANIEWLTKHRYSDEKLIIVAHNYHIAKYNQKETVMGEFLLENEFAAFYSIGFFAGAGSYADNNGKEVHLPPPSANELDIIGIIEALPGSVHFLPIPTKPETGGEWLDEDVIINDSFIDLNGSNQLVLSKHFDGLILIDRISPPEK